MRNGIVWDGLKGEEMKKVGELVGASVGISPRQLTGVILKYNEPRGFGFIRIDGTQDHIFYHIKDCLESGLKYPHHGQKVTFGLGQDTKGRRIAVNVTLREEEERN